MPPFKNPLKSTSNDHHGQTWQSSTTRKTLGSRLSKMDQTAIHSPTKLPKMNGTMKPAESSKMDKMDKTIKPTESPKMTKVDKTLRPAQGSRMAKMDQTKTPSAVSPMPKTDRTKQPSVGSRMATMDKSATTSTYIAPRDQHMASRHLSFDTLSTEEKDRQERWALQQLRIASVCPMGFDWVRYVGGYRCVGGNHWVSHESLASGHIIVEDFFLSMRRQGDPELGSFFSSRRGYV